MISFINGPAHGRCLMLSRTPRLLRVVIGPNDKLDALDQLEDVADASERIYVYRLTKYGGTLCIDGEKFRSISHMATYTFMEPPFLEAQPEESQIRDNDAWHKWCWKICGAKPEILTCGVEIQL